ncbi:hypothetical protein Bhyg_05533 [Pseudolycoriella hygida]|uniref:MADF domain-containing protein n=1 Tax=Pseudolycoriella hygida TaxID=35572 RepID=A0A9Q0S042_9DIPT|nr:hypothetical protein Bhyg_05533 [Pseudolycoriella hygida]
MSSKTEYEIDSQIAEGMEGLLADAIRKHPVLYAKQSNVRYKLMRPEKEVDAWNEISDELNLEVESCKSLWSCIKQKFIKYRKKLDNGDTFNKEWAIYENLHTWLDEHIKKRRTRNDIFKQIRVPSKQDKPIGSTSSTSHENEYVDEVESAEWNEIIDEPLLKDQVSPKQKRQLSKTSTVTTLTVIPKKKLKIELIQESDDKIENQDEEIFTEIDMPDVVETTAQICDKSTDDVEILKDTEPNDSIESNRNGRCVDRDIILEANFDKLEQVIEKCVNLAEKCIAEHSNQDSNEVFGKFIASLIRDLPQDRRMKVQFEIIQFTGQLVRRESNK